MKLIRIVLIIISITIYLNADSSKKITLSAKVNYTNTSNEIIKKIYHRITIPLERDYQKIKDISVIGADRYKIKFHKNDKVQKYIEFEMRLLPHQSINILVTFTIELYPYKFSLDNIKNDFIGFNKFTNSSKKIESNSKEFQKIGSDIFTRSDNMAERVINAYKYPSKQIIYQVQPATTALTALKTKKGDCTEYAMMFVAICRAMGIPSRVISLFNFKKRTTFSNPNHNEAEIYIPKLGWMPIYSNLGQGSEKNEYSPGSISDTNIVYSYNVWTWSNYMPNTKHLKGQIKQKTTWKVSEI